MALAAIGCGSRTAILAVSSNDAGGATDGSEPADVTVDAPRAHDVVVPPDARDASEDIGSPPPLCGIPAFDAPPVSPVCVPDGGATTLATLPGNSVAMLLDEGSFYISDASGFTTVPKFGGAFTKIVAPPRSGGGWSVIAFDTDAVYLGTDETGDPPRGLVRVPKAGGCATTLTTRPVEGIAVDDSFVYFEPVEADDGGPTTIEKMPKAGGETSIVVAHPLLGMSMTSLMIVGSWIYWMEGGAVCTATTGGGSRQVVFGGHQIDLWTADAHGVYVVARVGTTNDLFAVPFPPLAPAVTWASHVGGGGGEGSAIGDALSLYWADSYMGADAIMKTSEATGTTTVLVPGSELPGSSVSLPHFLQLDDACLYWQEENATLMTAPR
jgi:hypothetical protein